MQLLKSRGLGLYLAIPTVVALCCGVWFGTQIHDSPEEQILAEKLDSLSLNTQVLSDSILNEIERIKTEVQNQGPVDAQIKFWTRLQKIGNDLGGVEAISTLSQTTPEADIKAFQAQQYQLGKIIDLKNIERYGTQIFRFKNGYLGIAWASPKAVYTAWVSGLRSLKIEDRILSVISKNGEILAHTQSKFNGKDFSLNWLYPIAYPAIFDNRNEAGTATHTSADEFPLLAAYRQLGTLPLMLVVEQKDTSGMITAPVPIQIRLGQGLAVFGVLLLFGGMAALGLERKAKLKVYTADNPPPFEAVEEKAAATPPPFFQPGAFRPLTHTLVTMAQSVAHAEQVAQEAAQAAELAADDPLMDYFELPTPPPFQLKEKVAETPAETVEAKQEASGAEAAGPAQWASSPLRTPVEVPKYNDVESGRAYLAELERLLLGLSLPRDVYNQLTVGISKLCDSSVIFFEYRSDFKAALLDATAGFAQGKAPQAMSFPIADEVVSTISQNARQKKAASLSQFTPLCKVILDRFGVAHFDAWAVTSREGKFIGVMVILQAGFQSALHKQALTRLLSTISLSSAHGPKVRHHPLNEIELF